MFKEKAGENIVIDLHLKDYYKIVNIKLLLLGTTNSVSLDYRVNRSLANEKL